MPLFRYTAIDEAGHVCDGVMESSSEDGVVADMRQHGLFPTRVETAAAGIELRRPPLGRRRTGRKAVAQFTRQLATLLQSGLPLLRALQVLERQEQRPGFRWVLHELQADIVAGQPLAEAMARHGRVFPDVYLGMVRAGEAGGRLDVALQQLARFLEKADRIRRRVRAAMAYPLVVLVVTAGILVGLMAFVVPRFRAIFQVQLHGAAMPDLTRVVLAAGDFIAGHLAIISLAVAGLIAFGGALHASRSGRRVWDRVVLVLPGFGELRRKSVVARAVRTLGTLLGNGVPILQALSVARDTAGSVVYSECLDAVREQVQSGRAVAVALAAQRRFPEMLVGMAAVGEETGTLAEMLGRAADAYEEEVDTAVGGLTALLEPLLIVFLAVTVGTIVVALFLPIIRIIQTMS